MRYGLKERKGWTVEREGKLYIRIQFTDSLGKPRELMRRAKDRKHARQLQKELTKQLNSAEGNQRAELDAQKITFAKVAERYEAARLIPAVYSGDRNIARLRSLQTPKAYLKRLITAARQLTRTEISPPVLGHSILEMFRLKEIVRLASAANRKLKARLKRQARAGNVEPKLR